MAQEVVYLKQLSNLISNHCNMHLEIEKTRKDLLDRFGLLELMLAHEV